MIRFVIAGLTAIGLSGLPVAAQSQSSTTNNSSSDLSASSPKQNASTGAVSQRAPGTWVRSAIERHNTLKGQRLTGPRFGRPNDTEAQLRFGTTSGSNSSQSGSSDLSGLLNLLNQLGSTGSLGDLVNNLTGSSTSGSGTNYTLDDLIALGQSLGGSQKSSATQQSTTTTTSTTTQSTEESSFGARWASAMLKTFFSALTVGFQSDFFIEALKDVLRPLVLPSSDSGGSNADSGSGDGAGGDSGGGGIEDLSPGSGGSSGSSTI